MGPRWGQGGRPKAVGRRYGGILLACACLMPLPASAVEIAMTDATTFHAGYARYFTPPVLVEAAPANINLFNNTTGAVPTNQVSWDQPHEGNLFEHLYARRAFQKAVGSK